MATCRAFLRQPVRNIATDASAPSWALLLLQLGHQLIELDGKLIYFLGFHIGS